MALILADRVRDTTTTTGTGTVTLSGTAPTGYQNFSVIGNGNTTYYTINAGSQWEVGIGTYSDTGPTLARNTVLESSNGGALVNFSAGVKDVFVTYPADEVVIQDGATIAAGTAVLGVANGGTGLSSTPANGAIDIGNGTGFTRTTLTAGTNISITNGAGSITINATDQFVGTVTSVAASGGTTGMTFSGSPITTSGTLTLGGTLNVANGGTGATTLSSGYLLRGNGTSAVSASVIYDDGTNAMIGTTSALGRLTVQGDVNSNLDVWVRNDNAGSSSRAGLVLNASGNSWRMGMGSTANNSNALTWNVDIAGANTEYMRLTTGGNLLLGTTTNTGKKLTLAGSADLTMINTANTSGFDIGLLGGSADAGAYIYQRANSAMIFGTNNTERMRITSAGDVGIGTSSPGTRLQVRDAAAPSGFSSTSVRVTRDNYGADFVGYIDQGVGAGAIISTVDNGTPTERMRINSSGNVGIGTSSPDARLDVLGTSSDQLRLRTAETEEYRIGRNASTGLLDFYGSQSGFTGYTFGGVNGERMRITSDGSMQLSVGGVSNTHQFLYNESGGEIQLVDSTGAGPILIDNSGGLARFYKVGSGAISMGTTGANYFQFITNGAERMRIDSSGNVGIGTSSPGSRLDVIGRIGATNVQCFLFNSATGTYGSFQHNGTVVGDIGTANQVVTGGSNTDFALTARSATALVLGTNSTERMRISSAGNLGLGVSNPVARLNVAAGATVSAPVLGNVTNYPAFFSNSDSSYGLGIGVNPSDGRVWLQSQRADSAVAYNITLNEAGGNVGIGTSSPGVRLDVAGGAIRVGNTHSMQFRNAAGTGVAVYTLQSDDNFVVYNATGTPISSFTQGSTNIAVYGSNTNNRMQVDSINSVTSWIVNGSERARINSSGQFLIGTTSGGRTVCINAADNWIRQSNPSRSWLIGTGTGTSYVIYDETAGGARFSVDTAGVWSGPNAIVLGQGQNNDNRIELGAGRTGNNYAYVDLIGDTTYTDYGLRLLRGNGGPNATSELNHRGTGPLSINVQDAGVLVFSTSNTERMRISASGGVAIGGTGTDASLHIQTSYGGYDRLTQIAPSVANKPAFNIMAAKNSGGTDLWWSWGVDTSNRWRINQGVGFSTNGIILDDVGNLTVAQNVTAYSDARLKKDVETISGALDLVSKMRGVRYTRIDTDKRGVGVIAQEMLEVVPEVVQQGTGDDDTLSVAYGNLVGVLIEAIKELEARVAELEGK